MRRFTFAFVLLLFCVLPAWAQTTSFSVSGTIDDDTPFVDIPLTIGADGANVIIDIVPTGGDLDTLLYLVDSRGAIVAENDDRARGDFSSLIEFPDAEAGLYSIIATRYGVEDGDSSGTFELRVDITEPSAAIQAEAQAVDLSAFPDLPVRETAEWTVMVYYGGDNDLEAGILNDLREFELAGGSNEAVRILALVDRHPEFASDNEEDWDSTRLFEVGPAVETDGFISSVALTDLGELDTSAGDTLGKFITWAVQHFPAERYAVALGSHGAAWEGVIADYTTEDEIIIPLPELEQAFALGTSAAGVDQFDLLINDACYMSSVEYHAMASNYFDFSLASPEIVVNPALDMSLLIQHIRSDSIETLGKRVADKYILDDVQRRPSSDSVYLTSAVVRLAAMDNLVAAVERFAAIINEDPSFYSPLLGEARATTYTYSAFLNQHELIDLGHFMRQIANETNDATLLLATQDVVTALDSVIDYGIGGDRVASRTSYTNIYFPEDSRNFDSKYLAQSGLDEWGQMLRNFYNAVTPQVWSVEDDVVLHPPVAPKVRITSVHPSEPGSTLQPFFLKREVVGRNFAFGETTVDQIQQDGSVVRLSSERFLTEVLVDGQPERLSLWESGVDSNNLFWDVTLPVVYDDQSSFFELLIFTEEVAFMEGRYRERGSDTWHDVGIAFDVVLGSNVGTVQRVVSRAGGSDALAVVDIPAGSDFRSYRSMVTPDGRVIQEDGNLYLWPEGGLSWRWQPAESGEYEIGFLVTAFGGTTGFASERVRVNNEGVNNDLRGSTRTDLGFTIVRPVNWSNLLRPPGELLLRSTSENDLGEITVYLTLVGDIEDDLIGIANKVMEENDLRSDGSFREIDLNGIPAMEFDFTREDEDGVIFSGRAFATYNDAFKLGQVFAVQTASGVYDREAIYANLRDNIVFFDPLALRDSETTEWVFRPNLRGRTYQFPVRLDWLADPRTELGGYNGDPWWRYAPAEDSDTFAAFTTFDAVNQDAATLVERLSTEYLGPITALETSTFVSENHVWQTLVFTRPGTEINGRLYVTVVGMEAYAFWVETPDVTILAGDIEPMIDGFTVLEVE